MDFRIADTFTDSLARLTGEEQKAVKTTAFDLQLNPASPGLSFHKLDKARDKSFWSVRVSGDIRLIVHRTTGSLLLCYVDHHDKAYAWAERRKLETHPKTGAAQLVEIRERIEEVLVPKYVDVPQTPVPKRSVFASISNETLFSYGVPTDWVDVVREATEDTILELIDHLPREAGEALLDLATGVTPRLAVVPEVTDPFEHPDAQRRFRVMTNVEELERALEYPWDKWTVFLHPSQREVVDMQFAGQLGYTIKLLGIAKFTNGDIDARVHPTMIPATSPIAQVEGVYNAIQLVGDAVEDIVLYGRGAGSMPTGSAVVSDVIAIARNLLLGATGRVPPASFKQEERRPIRIRPMEQVRSLYYIRFMVLDRPGVLSQIAGVLGNHGISISSVIQQGRKEGQTVPVVIMTHTAGERNVQSALREIDGMPFISEPTTLIRVEEQDE